MPLSSSIAALVNSVTSRSNWNTEQGLALSGMDVTRAEVRQAALFDRVVDFFGCFDYLVCPATQVAQGLTGFADRRPPL